MRIVVQFGIVASAVFVSAVADARPATLSLNLQAEVAPYCRIQHDAADAPLTFVGDRAEIGAVREVCNTRSGYTVLAEFLNVSGGTVVAGNETAVLGPDGRASFSYGEARRQLRSWHVSNAQPAASGSPSYVRLSITPF